MLQYKKKACVHFSINIKKIEGKILIVPKPYLKHCIYCGHLLEGLADVLLMSIHNISFLGEIRKVSTLFVKRSILFRSYVILDVADDLLQVDLNEDANGEETSGLNAEGMEASLPAVKDLSDLVFTKHTGKTFI